MLVADKEDSADTVAALLTAKADLNMKYGVYIIYCISVF